MPNRITKEDFQERINLKYPDEKILIVDYTKASAPGTYKCLACGQTFKIWKMGELLRKKHCCYPCHYGVGTGVKIQEQEEQIKTLIDKDPDLEFIKFGYDHKNYKTTVEFKCKKCGNINVKTLQVFLKNGLCSYCQYGARQMNTAGLQARLPKGYSILEEYQGADKKILFRHDECGFIWKTTPHNLISGTGCPRCALGRSKGEKKIIHFLEQNSIKYESEKKFDFSGLRCYDFYLPEYNLLIEYNGIQHYKDIKFHGEYKLQEIQKIDAQKKSQALNQGFSYFVISYEDYNKIETLLAQRLNIEHPILDEDIV